MTELESAFGRLLSADEDRFEYLVRESGLDPACDFRHADLSGADLRLGDFTAFDFSYARFDGARIKGARFNATVAAHQLARARASEEHLCVFIGRELEKAAPYILDDLGPSFVQARAIEKEITQARDDRERRLRSAATRQRVGPTVTLDLRTTACMDEVLSSASAFIFAGVSNTMDAIALRQTCLILADLEVPFGIFVQSPVKIGVKAAAEVDAVISSYAPHCIVGTQYGFTDVESGAPAVAPREMLGFLAAWRHGGPGTSAPPSGPAPASKRPSAILHAGDASTASQMVQSLANDTRLRRLDTQSLLLVAVGSSLYDDALLSALTNLAPHSQIVVRTFRTTDQLEKYYALAADIDSGIWQILQS